MTDRQPVRVWDTLREALRRLSWHPTVVVLFLVAGLLSVGVEQLMLLDPVPSTTTTLVSPFQVTVDGTISGTDGPPVSASLGAFYGLRLPWLAARLVMLTVTSLGTLAVVVIGIAAIDSGDLRAGFDDLTPERFLRAVGLTVGILAGFGLLVGLAALVPVLALPVVLAILFVLLRLFVALPLVVRGHGLRRSVRESWRRVAGHGVRVLGIVLVLGLGSGLMGEVPLIGVLLDELVFAVQISAMTVVADLTGSSDTVSVTRSSPPRPPYRSRG
ncbi:hypothetical protein [Halorientalis salina]|uniref:hypothetical protein n=1 Tax=Halorientalis salina TaxID=2932266 RepID=UPI0010AD704F|nr:hypothetical protein [Halorientalis salina]